MLMSVSAMTIAVAIILSVLGIWQYASKSNKPEVLRKRAEHIASYLFWGLALIFVILALSSAM